MFEKARLSPQIRSFKDDLVGDVAERAVGADGHHRHGAADRLRQRRQPAAGAGRVAPAGAGGQGGARRRLGPDRPRAADGEPDAGRARRRGRPGPGVRRRCGCWSPSSPATCRGSRTSRIDLPVLLFAVGVVAAVGAAVRRWSRRSSRPARALAPTLRAGGRSVSASKERERARNVLVVAQVALALVLLVGSGLMIRTFRALVDVHPGFVRPGEVQTLRLFDPRVAGEGRRGGGPRCTRRSSRSWRRCPA